MSDLHASLSPGLSPLHLAVLRGHRHLSRMLIDAGADINAMVSPCAVLIHSKIYSSIKFYMYYFCILWFVFLFLFNKDIKSGQTPLMHAVESNNADMVHFLIEVMRVRGGKACDSALFDKIGLLCD